MARYIIRGKSKIVFAPAVASKAAPTRAEITAGTILAAPGRSAAASIADLSGFEARTESVAGPDLDSSFDKKFPGISAADNPTMTFHDDDATTTIRTALARGTYGYLIMMRYGDVPTKKCQVWGVRVGSLNDEWNMGNETGKFMVQFTPEEEPELNATIPA